MSVFHSVFGLVLHSNLAIPGLSPVEPSGATPDAELLFGIDPRTSRQIPVGPEDLAYVSAYTGTNGEPALRVWKTAHGDFLHMEYFDGAEFWLDRHGTRLWATWQEPLLLHDVATYVLGPVLGLLLRFRGVICLHASAVAFNGCAVAFVGSEGAGKSTTAAALARKGHAVISDDIVALAEAEGRFLVLPAYPYLSLWSQSAEMLFGKEFELPSFSPNYEKRQLMLADHHMVFAARPLPLGAIFLIAERTNEESAPWLELVTPRQSMVRLVADSYATNLLNADMRSREFALLGRLLAIVPVCRLHPHEHPSRIDRLCELVESHCRRLGSATASAKRR